MTSMTVSDAGAIGEDEIHTLQEISIKIIPLVESGENRQYVLVAKEPLQHESGVLH